MAYNRKHRLAAIGLVLAAMAVVGVLGYQVGRSGTAEKVALELMATNWDAEPAGELLREMPVDIPEGATLRFLELEIPKHYFPGALVPIEFGEAGGSTSVRAEFELQDGAYIKTLEQDRRRIGYVVEVDDTRLGTAVLVKLCLIEEALRAAGEGK